MFSFSPSPSFTVTTLWSWIASLTIPYDDCVLHACCITFLSPRDVCMYAILSLKRKPLFEKIGLF